MSKSNLDYFGQIIVSGARDASIGFWERLLEGKIKSAGSKLLYEELQKEFDHSQREIVLLIISQVVDTTVHNFLWTIEQTDDIDLIRSQEQGSMSLKSQSDGLTGELYSEDGWILRFSQKNYIEPS
ncbi:hypothetical protein D3C84_940500 [compost metagenome]